ncbi:MAG: hypothetical protein R2848_07180 [Thermomicrobiales bacterium]
MVRKRIVVTDLTRMARPDVCLAGIEAESPHNCIRPQLMPALGERALHPDEQWLYAAKGGPVRPFSIISFDAFRRFPSPPHTEDWHVSDAPVRVESILEEAERRALLESIEQPSIDEMFGAPVKWNQDPEGMRFSGRVEPRSGTASLGTLRIDLHNVTVSANPDGSLRYYVDFSDSSSTWNQARITDLSFLYWVDGLLRSLDGSIAELRRSLQSIFRAASLESWLRVGLARPFVPRGGNEPMCYVHVTGIYTFPDYLHGAAWCDFERPTA